MLSTATRNAGCVFRPHRDAFRRHDPRRCTFPFCTTSVASPRLREKTGGQFQNRCAYFTVTITFCNASAGIFDTRMGAGNLPGEDRGCPRIGLQFACHVGCSAASIGQRRRVRASLPSGSRRVPSTSSTICSTISPDDTLVIGAARHCRRDGCPCRRRSGRYRSSWLHRGPFTTQPMIETVIGTSTWARRFSSSPTVSVTLNC